VPVRKILLILLLKYATIECPLVLYLVEKLVIRHHPRDVAGVPSISDERRARGLEEVREEVDSRRINRAIKNGFDAGHWSGGTRTRDGRSCPHARPRLGTVRTLHVVCVRVSLADQGESNVAEQAT
jgi:hypothetical protein